MNDSQELVPASTTAPAPSGTAQAEPNAPFQAAKKVIMALELDRVRFSSFSAQGLVGPDNIPDATSFGASTKFLRPVVERHEGGFNATSTLVFQLTGQRGEDSETESFAVVRATFETVYAFKRDSNDFSDDDLRDFALCYCPFHAWGYWREFVQSSLSRMDLPAVTVPLYRIDMALKLVKDQID